MADIMIDNAAMLQAQFTKLVVDTVRKVDGTPLNPQADEQLIRQFVDTYLQQARNAYTGPSFDDWALNRDNSLNKTFAKKIEGEAQTQFDAFLIARDNAAAQPDAPEAPLASPSEAPPEAPLAPKQEDHEFADTHELGISLSGSDATAAEIKPDADADAAPEGEAANDEAPVSALHFEEPEAAQQEPRDPTDWSQIQNVFRPYDANGINGLGLNKASLTGFMPLNYNTMRLVAVTYGGPERDPAFLARLEQIAHNSGMSVQELLAADGNVLLKFEDPENPGQMTEREFNAQQALWDIYKGSSALTTDPVANFPLPLTEVSMQGKTWRERFATAGLDNAVLATMNDQQKHGANLLFKDSAGNVYTDNGYEVSAFVKKGDRYSGAMALNTARIYLSNRNTPFDPLNPQTVQFEVDTHKSRFSFKGRNSEHARMRDLTIMAGLHEARRSGKRLNIVDASFGKKTALILDVKQMNDNAVNEMRAMGLDVEGLIKWHNDGQSADAHLNNTERSVSIGGETAPETPSPANGSPAFEPAANAFTGKTLEDVARMRVGELTAGIASDDMQHLRAAAMERQAIMLAAHDYLTTHTLPGEDKPLHGLSGDQLGDAMDKIMRAPSDSAALEDMRVWDVAGKAEAASFIYGDDLAGGQDSLIEQKRAQLAGGAGVPEGYAAVPPIMQIMKARIDTVAPERAAEFDALATSAITLQAAARTEMILRDPENAKDNSLMVKAFPGEPQERQQDAQLFAAVKQAALEGRLDAIREPAAAGVDNMRTRAYGSMDPRIASELDKAFAPQLTPQPAQAAPIAPIVATRANPAGTTAPEVADPRNRLAGSRPATP